MTDSEASDTESPRKSPKDADIQMAARDDSKRYYFRSPYGGYTSIPATSPALAQTLVVDEFPDTAPEDWELITEEEARSMFR